LAAIGTATVSAKAALDVSTSLRATGTGSVQGRATLTGNGVTTARGFVFVPAAPPPPVITRYGQANLTGYGWTATTGLRTLSQTQLEEELFLLLMPVGSTSREKEPA
jgi:hypothetical protein